jgi:hypothetical protein
MVAADDEREDAAIVAAIADLGRDGPLRTDDLARARATLGEFRRRRRKAVVTRIVAFGGAALAAATVLALVSFGPELREQLGADDGVLSQSEHATAPEQQGGDAVDREAPIVRPREHAVVESPVVEPPVIEPPVVVPEPEIAIVSASPEPTPPRKTTAKPTEQASASEMLAKARALTHAKKLGPAVAAYEALLAAHPSSAEARAATVSLGRVQLSRGRAKPALKAFDRYLQGGAGTLAEEAHWGRIQALHALGRKRERDEATTAFASKFPGSMYLPKAKALASK